LSEDKKPEDVIAALMRSTANGEVGRAVTSKENMGGQVLAAVAGAIKRLLDSGAAIGAFTFGMIARKGDQIHIEQFGGSCPSAVQDAVRLSVEVTRFQGPLLGIEAVKNAGGGPLDFAAQVMRAVQHVEERAKDDADPTMRNLATAAAQLMLTPPQCPAHPDGCPGDDDDDDRPNGRLIGFPGPGAKKKPPVM
jgi:hypothetical protein